jgi:hypothetical protein
MNIKTIVNEKERGCGFRKPGGFYLVSYPGSFTCPKLPFPLEVCPCCGGGIKPARGFTWVNGKLLFREVLKNDICPSDCWLSLCLFRKSPEKVGLIWVGEQFYSTPEEFTREAIEQGISRRIHKIPQEFKLGETIVWLGHRSAVDKKCPECGDAGDIAAEKEWLCSTCHGIGAVKVPGVFTLFKPQRIEYILKGNETEEELERMEKRGITLIKLVRE